MAELTVMTRNVFLGASLDPIVTVPDVELMPRTVAEAWSRISGSLFPERAAAIALEVADHRPHLIGLQEVWDFTVVPAGGGPEATPVARLDYLEILQAELARCGLVYTVAHAATGPAFSVPSATGHAIHAHDRDVILCRGDVEVLESGGARYRNAATIRPGGEGGETMLASRAWARARVAVGGRPLWFLTTHLETPDFPAIQLAQAGELVEMIRDLDGSLVAVGDFNSGPGDRNLAPYELLVTSGLADNWALACPGDPGPTCGQDEDLRNADSNLSARIDLILTRTAGEPGVGPCRRALRVGRDPTSRTPSGLWPSDHAGVVAVLELADSVHGGPSPHR